MPRKATCRRSTKETRVSVMLDLDGSGDAAVRTGIGFFDHLLTSFAHHALFDLTVTTEGDVEVDDHHTVEDTALCVGEALGAALGDRTGIHRFGDARVPMDEAIAVATVDVGGRPYSVTDLELANPAIGALTAQNIPHALEAFARSAGITMHLTATGRNDHHVAEAAFKALARALRAAVSPDPRRSGVPSTKGIPSPEAS
ncbi:imidazoleglycerol-phosphate dehydratase HisB [Candidatus Spongiisocius sp.]|uniref:imidazoleglycerol-phosphate dehydratase HisB n=1 Tax=Candidatus Spongiisocius sp. TaxID=3101273 RepID=UPI003B5B35A8